MREMREAEARSSRRGEECIRPLAAADCWRPERPQPQQEEQEEQEEREQEEEEEREQEGGEELEQLVMTSVWGLKPGTTYITRSPKWYICKQSFFCKCYSCSKSFLAKGFRSCLLSVNQSGLLNEAFSLFLVLISFSFPFPREK